MLKDGQNMYEVGKYIYQLLVINQVRLKFYILPVFQATV